ncbi:MAG: LPS export ABC transporter periplasmic protein LptC [Leptospiraceae bacterium]|nr:LPS export ABC transporter periplasmic protein LptC [Leptospiraceae bacterium]MCP5497610.1 LPS export ABC transporter periplasmic protein LptC [Leptospiraceae bacterium]
MRKKFFILNLLLFIFVLVFAGFCKKKNRTERIESEKESGSTIRIKNFKREAFDTKGGLLWKVTAGESFTYIGKENKTILYQLNFDQYEDGKFKSNVKGDRGEINHSSKKLYLSGNIILNTEDGKTLWAEELEYDLDEKKLYSEKKVKILSGGTVIYGRGLRADRNLNKFTILKPEGMSRENPFKKE